MFVVNILGNFMKFCYELFSNYGIAIILFTLFSKLVLLPISIMVQKNSIKMVKMQPEINKIKINYFGDKDTIADEQAKLYKKEKYNPLTSLVPLVIQIVLLMVVVEVINHPLTYIVKTPKEVTNGFAQIAIKNNKLDEESTSLELAVVNDIKEKNNISLYEKALEELDEEISIINEIESLNLGFLGFDLSWIAISEKGLAILIPVIAGIGAFLLCIAQNKMNVLQTWQEKSSQYGMLVFSVGLSLYLGVFVPAGVALYWTASNLFAILQQWLLNISINPKKYVDFEELVFVLDISFVDEQMEMTVRQDSIDTFNANFADGMQNMAVGYWEAGLATIDLTLEEAIAESGMTEEQYMERIYRETGINKMVESMTTVTTDTIAKLSGMKGMYTTRVENELRLYYTEDN